MKYTNPIKDTNPVQEALNIENASVRAIIDSLKNELVAKDPAYKLENALSIAINHAVRSAPPAYCFHMEQTVRRIFNEVKI